MKTKNGIKAACAVAILSLGATPGLAAAQAASGPIPTGQSDWGGVFLSVWNSSVSVVTYLGETLDQFGVDAVASGNPRYTTDLSVFGGNLEGVEYAITAAKFNGLDPRSWVTAFTSEQSSVDFMDGSQISGSNSAITQFLVRVNDECGTTVPCKALNDQAGAYAGAFVDSLNPSLPVSANAAIGTPMSFFYAFGTSDLEGDPATVLTYRNALGVTAVNLAEDGTLTFTTPIPLPAAAWLLLSGLAGLIAVGRRRAAA